MQPLSLKICVYTGAWNSGHDFNYRLCNAFAPILGEAQNRKDVDGSLFHRYVRKEDGLSIDIKKFNRYLQIESEGYNLIYLLDRCVAVNKELNVGDLVIIDGASRNYDFIYDSMEEVCGDLSVLKEQIGSVGSVTEKIIKYINNNSGCSIKDIKLMLDCFDEEWKTIVQDVIGPNNGILWMRDRNNNNSFSLTEEGKLKLKAYDNEEVCKPAVKVGISHCLNGMISSLSSDIFEGMIADVIDQRSKTLLSKTENLTMPILNVCAVKVLASQDIESESFLSDSIFNNFSKFILKVAEIYKRSIPA